MDPDDSAELGCFMAASLHVHAELRQTSRHPTYLFKASPPFVARTLALVKNEYRSQDFPDVRKSGQVEQTAPWLGGSFEHFRLVRSLESAWKRVGFHGK